MRKEEIDRPVERAVIYLEEICDSLEGLKHRDRAIILLYYFWGYTQDEIAELYDLSQETISRILKYYQNHQGHA